MPAWLSSSAAGNTLLNMPSSASGAQRWEAGVKYHHRVGGAAEIRFQLDSASNITIIILTGSFEAIPRLPSPYHGMQTQILAIPEGNSLTSLELGYPILPRGS